MIKNMIIAACVAMLSLSACGKQAEADAPKAVIKPVPKLNLLENTALLQTAQTTLPQQEKLRGKTVYIFENINFFDGVRPRIELSIQDPQRPNKLLFYRYEHERWHFVDDEENTEHINRLSRHLTPLHAISFVDVPKIAQIWRQKAQETQAVIQEPYHIAFVLLPKTQQRFWHTAELEAQGAQYYLSIFPDFRIFEFKKL